MAREDYEIQVALLVRLLPHVAKEKAFALKGGTAINLFYRDLPRLSVDIDRSGYQGHLLSRPMERTAWADRDVRRTPAAGVRSADLELCRTR